MLHLAAGIHLLSVFIRACREFVDGITTSLHPSCQGDLWLVHTTTLDRHVLPVRRIAFFLELFVLQEKLEVGRWRRIECSKFRNNTHVRLHVKAYFLRGWQVTGMAMTTKVLLHSSWESSGPSWLFETELGLEKYA